MAADRIQTSSLIATDSQGGEYLVTQAHYHGGLSSLDQLTLELISDKVDPSQWLGQKFQLQIYQVGDGERSPLRSYSGIATDIKAAPELNGARQYGYQVILQPWLALLKYSRASRVFQEMTSREIISDIFDQLGFKGRYKFTNAPSHKRAFCLQLDESDFDFVSRLLAEEGMHFYTGSDKDADTLFLQLASKPYPSAKPCTLDEQGSVSGSYDTLVHWQPGYAIHSAKGEVGNYDYSQSNYQSAEKPSSYSLSGTAKLIDQRSLTASISGDMSDIGQVLASLHRSQLDSDHLLHSAQAQSTNLALGNYLTINQHSDSDQQGDYLVCQISYSFDGRQASGLSYDCQFSCVPKDHNQLPKPLEKPRISGYLSAVVAGKTEAEPASDEQGRVRIQFHWDSEASGDKTSCWVRVAQTMAGSSYGAQFIPRAGQEVIVSFLNGDIDQPLVTGSLYNSQNKPPYAEQNTTQSGFKTQLKGQSNELRFDDKEDAEQLYLHAAKDMLTEVENDAEQKVLNEKRVEVSADYTASTEQNFTLSAKENIDQSSEKDFSLTATQALDGKGKTITLTADDTLELVVGSSKITIDSSSITLKSTEILLDASSKLTAKSAQVAVEGQAGVKVKSSANMDLEAGVNLTAKANVAASLQGSVSAEVKGNVQAKLEGAAMATVKGGIVMVN